MKLHELIKVKVKNAKRVGRGLSSGKGKTSGRGTKGQKARGKIPATFTGAPALYKKLPLKRGFGNPKKNNKPKLIQLSKLDIFPKGAVVDLISLIEKKLVNEKALKKGIKIVAGGKITKPLIIKVAISENAKKELLKVKGRV